jgi:predicted flavoprotein YhiN
MVVNRVINLKNHLAENLPIRLFRVIQQTIHATARNVQKRSKMKSRKLFFAIKNIHIENLIQSPMIVINQSLLL